MTYCKRGLNFDFSIYVHYLDFGATTESWVVHVLLAETCCQQKLELHGFYFTPSLLSVCIPVPNSCHLVLTLAFWYRWEFVNRCQIGTSADCGSASKPPRVVHRACARLPWNFLRNEVIPDSYVEEAWLVHEWIFIKHADWEQMMLLLKYVFCCRCCDDCIVQQQMFDRTQWKCSPVNVSQYLLWYSETSGL